MTPLLCMLTEKDLNCLLKNCYVVGTQWNPVTHLLVTRAWDNCLGHWRRLCVVFIGFCCALTLSHEKVCILETWSTVPLSTVPFMLGKPTVTRFLLLRENWRAMKKSWPHRKAAFLPFSWLDVVTSLLWTGVNRDVPKMAMQSLLTFFCRVLDLSRLWVP